MGVTSALEWIGEATDAAGCLIWSQMLFPVQVGLKGGGGGAFTYIVKDVCQVSNLPHPTALQPEVLPPICGTLLYSLGPFKLGFGAPKQRLPIINNRNPWHSKTHPVSHRERIANVTHPTTKLSMHNFKGNEMLPSPFMCWLPYWSQCKGSENRSRTGCAVPCLLPELSQRKTQ